MSLWLTYFIDSNFLKAPSCYSKCQNCLPSERLNNVPVRHRGVLCLIFNSSVTFQFLFCYHSQCVVIKKMLSVLFLLSKKKWGVSLPIHIEKRRGRETIRDFPATIYPQMPTRTGSGSGWSLEQGTESRSSKPHEQWPASTRVYSSRKLQLGGGSWPEPRDSNMKWRHANQCLTASSHASL